MPYLSGTNLRNRSLLPIKETVVLSDKFDFKPIILTCMAYIKYKTSINKHGKTEDEKKYQTILHKSDNHNFSKIGYKLEYFELEKGTDTLFKKKTSTGAVLAYHLNDNNFTTIYVSFRGTVDINDWLTNIQSKTTHLYFEGGRVLFPGNPNAVHNGFKKSYDSSFSRIIGRINSILYDKPVNRKFKITIAGHSLGGALANVCFAHLLAIPAFLDENKCVLLKLETYGAPRVFTKKTALQIESEYINRKSHIKVYRYVNKSNSWNFFKNKDVVARIPPPITFKHLGEEHALDSDKVPKRFVLKANLTPHAIDGYFFGLYKEYG